MPGCRHFSVEPYASNVNETEHPDLLGEHDEDPTEPQPEFRITPRSRITAVAILPAEPHRAGIPDERGVHEWKDAENDLATCSNGQCGAKWHIEGCEVGGRRAIDGTVRGRVDVPEFRTEVPADLEIQSLRRIRRDVASIERQERRYADLAELVVSVDIAEGIGKERSGSISGVGVGYVSPSDQLKR